MLGVATVQLRGVRELSLHIYHYRTTSLAIAALIASVFAALVFLGNTSFAEVGMVLWRIGMGAQESIVKAPSAIAPRLMARGVRSAGFSA